MPWKFCAAHATIEQSQLVEMKSQLFGEEKTTG
jgi:hypothetical protein